MVINSFRKMSYGSRVEWVLPTVLLLGAIVRLWGINFGLPHTECRPDETALVSRSIQFFSGDFNPHFFVYPTLYMYVLFGVYLVYYVFGQMLGVYQSPDDLMREFVLDPSHLYLLDRLLSAGFGVATIAVVYLLVQRVYGFWAGAIAALFLSVAPLHVRDSHFGVTDVSQAFLIVTAVFFICCLEGERKGWKNYLWAGIFSGLALSTKYTSLPLVGAFLVAHSLGVMAERDGWKQKMIDHRRLIFGVQLGLILLGMILIGGAIVLTPDFVTQYLSADGSLENPDRLPALQKVLATLGGVCLGLPILLQWVPFFRALVDRGALMFGGGVLAAFLVGTPFALLDPKVFASEFANVIRSAGQAAQAPHVESLGMGFVRHFNFSLPLGLGVCLFTAAFLGCGAAVRLNRSRAAVMLAFPVFYYIFMGKTWTAPVRYMTPVIPFACMMAALGVVVTVERLSKWVSVKRVFLSCALVTLILVQPVAAIVQSDGLLATTDNRLVAAEWFRENVPQSAAIYQTGTIYGQMVVDRSPRLVIEQLRSPQINGQKTLAEKLLPMQEDYLERYPQWDYDASVGIFYFNRRLQTGLPDYIVVQEDAVEPETVLEAGIAEVIQSSYVLRRSFRAMERHVPGNYFDRQDAFYLPFAGFRNVRRPGTNLYVYQLTGQLVGEGVEEGGAA
jgi:4-amino-4-deoxy-L-arabinose transferase-like glycosyltransferase